MRRPGAGTIATEERFYILKRQIPYSTNRKALVKRGTASSYPRPGLGKD